MTYKTLLNVLRSGFGPVFSFNKTFSPFETTSQTSSDLLNEVIFSDLEKTLRSWILVLLEKLRLSGNHMLFGNTSSSFYLDKQVKKLTSSEADADLLLTNN